ncbi:MAG: uracil-DNA glycosylase [Petrotogales bacterium]
MTIEELKKRITNCKKCRLSETRKHPVLGEGNPDSRFMIVAQAPGEKEDKQGEMFVGPSGEVLFDLLDKVGLNKEDVYMTNLIKCMLPNNRKPKQDEINTCTVYLDNELNKVTSSVVITLGHYASRYLLKKNELKLPHNIEFHEIYGKLFLGKGIKILPLEHPAVILYNEDSRERLQNHYQKISVLQRECKWFPICPMKRFNELGILDSRWIELYCRGDWKSCVRYKMEEKGEPHPDWLLPDGALDESLRGRW